ncbi:MAG TPA: hypothetical protein VK139_06275 [Microbacteriaceae bacterium]|nr:hypothetical protein [Microbacteriaceae bacterium]
MSELDEWMRSVSGPALVTIDGPSGAGKSTFATALHERHSNWQLIRLDDVYRGWDDLLPTVEVMRDSCVLPLLGGAVGVWPKWSWPRTGPIVPTEVPARSRLIIEGCGSTGMVPVGAEPVRHIWLDTAPGVRQQRIQDRDGRQFDAYWPTWFAQWERYELTFRPRERCEIVPG